MKLAHVYVNQLFFICKLFIKLLKLSKNYYNNLDS